MSGHLFGIGVGPGDPELMTLKAVRLLSEVAVIAYPAPDTGESSARAIASSFIPSTVKEIAIRVPMRPGIMPVEVYDKAAETLAGHLMDGRDVAVLCEGDPFFYGSFIYLYERLAYRFDASLVPGVSSLMACAGVAGSPLVRRSGVLSVLPATLDDENLSDRLTRGDGLAIIKVGRHLPRLRRILAEKNLLDSAHYVAHATRDDQAVLPLKDLKLECAPYFSMLLIPQREAQ